MAATADEPVRVERRDDGVAVIRLDRPTMNALSTDLVRRIGETVDTLADDPPGALVVWGGPRLFAAGADIEELAAGVAVARAVADGFHRSLDALATFPRATIAAVTGYALGGGLELALACDFRVVADTATLGLPEIQLGVIPGGGGTQRLARLVGPARAKDLIFTGRHVGSAEAMAIGLADRVVARVDVLDEAIGWAAELARGAVAAQALAKRAVDGGLQVSLPSGLAAERDLFVEVFGTEDAAIGIRSFLDNGPGKATFTGR